MYLKIQCIPSFFFVMVVLTQWIISTLAEKNLSHNSLHTVGFVSVGAIFSPCRVTESKRPYCWTSLWTHWAPSFMFKLFHATLIAQSALIVQHLFSGWWGCSMCWAWEVAEAGYTSQTPLFRDFSRLLYESNEPHPPYWKQAFGKGWGLWHSFPPCGQARRGGLTAAGWVVKNHHQFLRHLLKIISELLLPPCSVQPHTPLSLHAVSSWQHHLDPGCSRSSRAEWTGARRECGWARRVQTVSSTGCSLSLCPCLHREVLWEGGDSGGQAGAPQCSCGDRADRCPQPEKALPEPCFICQHYLSLHSHYCSASDFK